MSPRLPIAKRTDSLCPYTTLFLLTGNFQRAFGTLPHQLDEQGIAQLAFAQQIIGGFVEFVVARGLRQQTALDEALKRGLRDDFLVDDRMRDVWGKSD